MIRGMFWPFSGSEGSPRVPESLKWFTINDVVCPENLGLNILLWDGFTMEKPYITYKDGGKRNIGLLQAYFSRNQFLKEPPRGPEDP